MDNMKDFELDTGMTPPEGEAAGMGDLEDLLNTAIAAGDNYPLTESTDGGDPVPTHHEVAVPVPNKTEMTADTYNKAIAQLERTFKEGAAILGDLRQITVVPDIPIEDQQAEFTESVTLNAIFESYLDDVYVEASGVDNKAEIKAAVRGIKKTALSPRADKHGLMLFKFDLAKRAADVAGGAAIAGAYANTKSSVVAIVLKDAIMTAGIQAGLMAGKTLIFNNTAVQKHMLNRLRDDKTVKAKLWQMVGSFLAEEDELTDVLAEYEKTFDDQLKQGDVQLKLGAIKLRVTYRTKEKNYDGFTYILTVDNTSDTSDTINLTADESDIKAGKLSDKTKSDKK